MTNVDQTTATPRILIADDDAINVRVLTALLRKCGLTSESAHDGQDCVNKAEAGNYDLILMDINMPNMDGVEATREIARRMPPPGPKVIAVTANASTAQRQECDAAGFAGFVPKPVRLDQLKAALDANLPLVS